MCSLGRGSEDLRNGTDGNFWRHCVLAPRLRGFICFFLSGGFFVVVFFEGRIFCCGFFVRNLQFSNILCLR
jgi:hypothetical protein